MKRLTVIAITVGFFFLAGCGGGVDYPSRATQLTRVGLLGEHQLRRAPVLSTGTYGSFSGSFFFGSGGISGQISSQPMLTFYWGRTDGEIFATTLPLSVFQILVDSKEIPTVEFVFDDYWLGQTGPYYTFSRSDLANMNNFVSVKMIDAGLLKSVIIRITKTDLDREPFLPK